MRHFYFLMIALLLASALGVAQPAPVNAATTITVNTAEDDTDPGDGCSLREAINNANSNSQPHADCLAGSDTDTILFSSGFGTATITLGSPLPVITDPSGLVINGAGVRMTVSGNNAVRVFEVGVGATLTVQNLTIANGFGIGGGIYNSGTLAVQNSTIRNNDGLDPGSGGGIHNNGGTATITNSTLTGNIATSGGAIYNNTGTVTVTNSTIYANALWGAGGSIVYNAGTMTIRNSILANGSGANLCGGAVFAAGSTNNLSDDSTCGTSFVQKTLAELALGPLTNNGGSTSTFGLLPVSVAINAADNPSCPSTDQRGTVRPQGTLCDVGAFESKVSFSLVPASLTFTSQLVGTTSAPQSVILTNTGEANSILGTLSITGEFAISNNTCNGQTIIPGGTCSFSVTFSPLTGAVKTGSVSIPSNIASSPTALPLSGTGYSAVQLLKAPTFDALVIPLPWRTGPPIRSLLAVRDCTVGLSPPCSVKFTGLSYNPIRTVQQALIKTGVAGDKYYFGLSSRALNVPAGGQYKVEIIFYNVYLQIVGSQALTFTDGTHDFETLTSYYTVPATYFQIVFRVTYQKTSGTAWFDNAFLMRAP